jgi:hypothetical protein
VYIDIAHSRYNIIVTEKKTITVPTTISSGERSSVK